MSTDPAGEATSLEMLADYECPECGPLVGDSAMSGVIAITEDEATMILGGDEAGFLRCPNDWCGEELEMTVEARLDLLAMVAERIPALAPQIVAAVSGIAADAD